MNKLDKMMSIGLEVVDLEMYEGTEEEVLRLENKLWEVNK